MKIFAFFSTLCFLGFANAQLVFKSNLDTESSSCWQNRTASGCGAFASIQPMATTSLATSGSEKAIKITYTANEQQGGTELTVNESHIFTKFHFRYSSGFDFGCGVKSHRIRSMNEARGVNNYDIIIYTEAAGSEQAASRSLCGVNDMGSINIARNGGSWWGSSSFKFQRDKWYELETEIKLNTPGFSNGEARMWIGDSLVFARTDLNIRDTMTAPINRVMFGGWYSNGCRSNPCPNPDSTTESSYLLDTMSISRMRISKYDREFFPSPAPVLPPVVSPPDTLYILPREFKFQFIR
jgi:hypothetical protein